MDTSSTSLSCLDKSSKAARASSFHHNKDSTCPAILDQALKPRPMDAPTCLTLTSFGATSYPKMVHKCWLKDALLWPLSSAGVQGCLEVMDVGLARLSRSCPDLRYLCLSGCGHLTNATLTSLAQHCPQLATLVVARYSFRALARNCNLLKRMDLEECFLITDAALSYLTSGCPCLEKLILSHCELITDEGIRSVGVSPCSAEHVAVLELDNIPLITDAALDNLISCHSLQRIELYDCQLITRAGISRPRNCVHGPPWSCSRCFW